MTVPIPPVSPDEAAAAWVVRLIARAPTDLDRQAFKTWLEAHPENRASFERARTAYAEADRLPFLQRATRRKPAPPRTLFAAGGALAAGLAALAVMPSLELVGTDLRAQSGEVRVVVLDDGTRLWLDSASAVDLQYSATERTVDLRRGRLFVEVAADARPFSIRADDAVVRDIGTGFSVDTAGPGLTVAVESGIVDVQTGDRVQRLTAHQQAVFDAGNNRLSALNADDLAWRTNRLILDRTPVRQAVREIGRYKPERLVWWGKDSRARVSGVLRLDNLDEGLETLAADHGLRLVRLPGMILVIEKS